jgi:chromosome segregation ATPase
VPAYLRISNAPLPEDETLQEERLALRRKTAEFLAACQKHFKQVDARRVEDLLAERDDLTREAKSLLQRINTQQDSGGYHVSGRSNLQSNLERAMLRQQEFVPVNRTTSTLEEIERDEAEQAKLGKAVDDAREAIQQNHRNILLGMEQLNDLRGRYRDLEEQEERIVAEVEQLRLPPDQRKRRSSVVWQDGDSTFSLQLP